MARPCRSSPVIGVRVGAIRRGALGGLKGKTMARPKHGSAHLFATPLGVPRSLGRATVTPGPNSVPLGIRIHSDHLWVRNHGRVTCLIVYRPNVFS